MGITCKGILDPLSDYLQGEAGDKICREIEDHLRGCEKCRMHIDKMKLLITLYKPWKDDAIPEDVSIRLRNVIAEEARRKTTSVSARKRARRASAGKHVRKSTGRVARKSSSKARRGSPNKSARSSSKKKR